MYTYRIVLDAYNSRWNVRPARVVTFSQGWNRQDALKRLGTIYIACDGQVSDGINPWPGTSAIKAEMYRTGKLPVTSERALPEYTVVSMRSIQVRTGAPKILAE